MSTAPHHRILIGDVLDGLRSLPDGSARCCVTSPPYWSLRDYGMSGQIGLESTPEAYIERMVGVFREVRRVLADDGTVFLNVGDSYWANGPRQTGRNDSDRETPGGRGGSFRGGVRRAVVCGIDDTAPGDFPERGCLCGSLCGVCLAVFRRTTRSDPVLAAMLHASLPASTRERMESATGHPPTLGSEGPAARNANATPDLGGTSTLAASRLHASLVSILGESSPQLLGECLQRASRGECPLCARSSAGCVPVCVDTAACMCGISGRGSDAHSLGTGAGALAYPHCTTASLKPKDLVGIPWMLAFALRADGWYLRSDIIWAKANPMPESVTDRPTKSHEYVFLLSKRERYYYDAEAIKEPSVDPESHRGRNPRNDDRFVGQAFSDTRGGFSKIEAGTTYPTRNARTVWTIATQPYSEAHFATFPEAIPERCVKAGSSERGKCPECGAAWRRVVERTGTYHDQPGRVLGDGCPDRNDADVHGGRVGDGRPSRTTGWEPGCDHGHEPIPDTVLDPFAGSGTTLLVACRLGRNAIGCELNPEYAAMAERRIGSGLRPSTFRDDKLATDAPLFGATA